MTDQKMLSTDGLARRDAMRESLKSEVGVVRRGRQRRRAGLSAMGLVLASGVVWAVMPRATVDIDRSPIVDARPSILEPTSRGPLIERVGTDPDIRNRYFAGTKTGARRFITTTDDDTLLATLASIDRPAGLVDFGGRVALSRDVTDEGLQLDG